MDISTPFGGDVLLFRSISANEELGRLFEFQIEVLSERNDLDPDQILGKNVTVKLELPYAAPRCFDGCVTRFGLSGRVGRYHRYRLTARPWLWLLTRTSDCRIFQNKTVPDILKDIFDKYPAAAFESRLTGSYSAKDYCVQYRETDFNFVSRLMEQEGIYYYFEHRDGGHTLVLADGPSAHTPFGDYGTIPFIPHDRGGRLDQEYVDEWYFSREIQPGAYVSDDFDFIKPSADLRVSTRRQRGHAEAGGEYYDYPGEYTQAGDGDHYVKVRLEELQARHELIEGGGNARGITVGSVFRLTGQPRDDQNREYLVVRSTIEFEDFGHESQETAGARFRCNFAVLDSRESFRTQRLTPKPTVQGPQTAIVVGPKGDEIYTDEYGRVKVQFHWDRLGELNQNSSCWVRVSHPWAGKNFGMIAIPRIGQEVIVDFLEGDPDQPMVTGRVYNAENMPPWPLADHKTRSGIVTRSSLGGSSSTANELRFEDKMGAEEVFLHAERQLRTEVEVDELRDVGHDRKSTIHNDETLTVEGQRLSTITKDETLRVTTGNRLMEVQTGTNTENITGFETRTLKSGRKVTIEKGGEEKDITGALKETIKNADVTQTLTTGSYTQTVSTGNATHFAQAGHVFNTPATILLKADTNVTINSPQLILTGGASVTGSAPKSSWFVGFDAKMYGMVMKATGLTTEFKGLTFDTKFLQMTGVTYKGEFVGVRDKSDGLNKGSAVLELKTIGTAVKSGGVALYKKAISIWA